MVREGAIVSQSGKRIAVTIDTVRVRGDNPAAVAVAGRVRDELEQAAHRDPPDDRDALVAPGNRGRAAA
jgi:lactam utilization protein B